MDLIQGQFCSIGSYQNFGICFGTVIENAIGSAGADTLIGNPSNNRLTGNGGADTFVFGNEWGSDTITDFAPADDKLDFSKDASLNYLSLNISTLGGNTIITYGTDMITLLGVTQAIPQSAFVFYT